MKNITVPKDNAFNFLRLICALIVIYEHAIVLTGVEGLPCLNLRGTAVNVFFILSGFWVTQSYLRSNSIGDYAKKRCNKIFPLYFFVVIASALLLVFFSNLSAKEYFTDSGFYKYLLANLSTLNFIHPTLPGVFDNLALGGSVNGSLWTIKIELGFYILLPVIIYIMKLISKNKENKKECIILFAVYLLSVLYEFFIPIITQNTFLPSSLDNQLPAYLSYFISGMLMIYFWNFVLNKLNLLIILSAIIFVLFSLLNIPFVSCLVKPITLCIIVIWIGLNLQIFKNIGSKKDYSYSMYLVHYPLIMCFISSTFFELNWSVAFLGVLGATFLISFILEKIMDFIIKMQTSKTKDTK